MHYWDTEVVHFNQQYWATIYRNRYN